MCCALMNVKYITSFCFCVYCQGDFFSLLNAFLLTNNAKILVSDGATSSPGFLVPFPVWPFELLLIIPDSLGKNLLNASLSFESSNGKHILPDI